MKVLRVNSNMAMPKAQNAQPVFRNGSSKVLQKVMIKNCNCNNAPMAV